MKIIVNLVTEQGREICLCRAATGKQRAGYKEDYNFHILSWSELNDELLHRI